MERLNVLARGEHRASTNGNARCWPTSISWPASTLRLDHRLNHVRDEVGKGEPTPTYEEMRRAAFLTALVCYELDRAVGGR